MKPFVRGVNYALFSVLRIVLILPVERSILKGISCRTYLNQKNVMAVESAAGCARIWQSAFIDIKRAVQITSAHPEMRYFLQSQRRQDFDHRNTLGM